MWCFSHFYIYIAFICVMICLSFILFLQSPVSLYFMFSCLIVATLSYCLCCDFSWFVKLFKLMESYYSVVIFFFIYGLSFLFFPLLYFLMVSSLFFMISHLWMWWVLTRWFNYRIVIRKVSSTAHVPRWRGFSPIHTKVPYARAVYVLWTVSLLFSQQDLQLQGSSWFRISSHKIYAKLFPVETAGFSLIALVAQGATSEPGEECNTSSMQYFHCSCYGFWVFPLRCTIFWGQLCISW